MAHTCPQCGEQNETSAIRCECGFFFLKDLEKKESLGLVRIRQFRRDRVLRKITVIASSTAILVIIAIYFSGFLRAQVGDGNEVESRSLLARPTENLPPNAIRKPIFPENNVPYRVTRVFTARAIGVADSDNQEHRVTIMGIRAPKLDENFGPESRDFLASLVSDRSVIVKLRASTKEDETIAELLIDGSNIGLEQIRQGMAALAVEEIAPLSPEEKQQYLEAGMTAKNAKIGIWNDRNGVKPPSGELTSGETTASRPGKQQRIKGGEENSADYTSAPQANESPAGLEVEPTQTNTDAPVVKKEPAQPDRDKTSHPPASGNKYTLGPRGGCFYITATGNKVYVDRSMCN